MRTRPAARCRAVGSEAVGRRTGDRGGAARLRQQSGATAPPRRTQRVKCEPTCRRSEQCSCSASRASMRAASCVTGVAVVQAISCECGQGADAALKARAAATVGRLFDGVKRCARRKRDRGPSNSGAFVRETADPRQRTIACQGAQVRLPSSRRSAVMARAPANGCRVRRVPIADATRGPGPTGRWLSSPRPAPPFAAHSWTHLSFSTKGPRPATLVARLCEGAAWTLERGLAVRALRDSTTGCQLPVWASQSRPRSEYERTCERAASAAAVRRCCVSQNGPCLSQKRPRPMRADVPA